MTDQPYETGFLEEIIAVHFGGGDWITVYAFPAEHDNAATHSTITASFPGLVGGTPGVPCLTDNLHPAGFFDTTRTLTAADVQRQVKTASTRSFTSFGIYKRELAVLGDSGTPADEIQCYFQIPSELKAAGIPFIMKLFTTIIDPNLSNQPLQVGTLREKTVVPGYVATIPPLHFIGSEPGIVGFANAAMNPLNPFEQFRIDPKTLSVEWLF